MEKRISLLHQKLTQLSPFLCVFPYFMIFFTKFDEKFPIQRSVLIDKIEIMFMYVCRILFFSMRNVNARFFALCLFYFQVRRQENIYLKCFRSFRSILGTSKMPQKRPKFKNHFHQKLFITDIVSYSVPSWNFFLIKL